MLVFDDNIDDLCGLANGYLIRFYNLFMKQNLVLPETKSTATLFIIQSKEVNTN